MPAWTRHPVALGIVALLLVIVAASTFAIVPETKQAVIVRFEQPVGTVNRWKPGEQIGRSNAGLLARIPFVDHIIWIDKRVLDIDLDNQPVLSTDQIRLEVDAFARFRVVDPLRMVQAIGLTSGSETRVRDALAPLFSSALRSELGKRDYSALLSPERGQLMDNIQIGLQRLANNYGIEIIDVRIKHADLPEGSPLDSALERMRSARAQQALTIRSQGQREAQIIRADADAQAAQIYAAAFNKDADFYDFYRAMQSYRRTFGADGSKTPPAGETNLILTPDNAYLKEFEGRAR
ncbi:protease modulator HflC [uncultured Sphingomonas sp.]|uniref:protease modulator HflC n=1 Tax=uncultured Sphingomonas sp. TaxID=158754 RepID=UPI0035CBE93B